MEEEDQIDINCLENQIKVTCIWKGLWQAFTPTSVMCDYTIIISYNYGSWVKQYF